MGYNKGDSYESVIFEILKQKGLLPNDSERAGAGGGVDIQFLYRSRLCNLEVKLDLKADYGQKTLGWKDGKWFFNKSDVTTDFYTKIGIIDYVNQKNIVPNKYRIAKDHITQFHKQADQSNFEDSVNISINALYDYYAEKKCYYIQIGGYGFYHLKMDYLQIGTPQFNCNMQLRLRAKTVRSNPIHNYGFYAVLKPQGKPKTQSPYDIEEKSGRIFPPIQ
ncbi:hypothetical protein [Limnospira platensis]|uniref:hypothetical protein n=1 Tax=Limnospira platensis TaxID=118562 RepID=UPI0002803D4E|nr:hypothetical protein SPLC1_S500410 [Arthrospira platensis C1]UWU48081.1 hypothetical protein APLC1_2870 [Arthrospira platensis C1]